MSSDPGDLDRWREVEAVLQEFQQHGQQVGEESGQQQSWQQQGQANGQQPFGQQPFGQQPYGQQFAQQQGPHPDPQAPLPPPQLLLQPQIQQHQQQSQPQLQQSQQARDAAGESRGGWGAAGGGGRGRGGGRGDRGRGGGKEGRGRGRGQGEWERGGVQIDWGRGGVRGGMGGSGSIGGGGGGGRGRGGGGGGRGMGGEGGRGREEGRGVGSGGLAAAAAAVEAAEAAAAALAGTKAGGSRAGETRGGQTRGGDIRGGETKRGETRAGEVREPRSTGSDYSELLTVARQQQQQQGLQAGVEEGGAAVEGVWVPGGGDNLTGGNSTGAKEVSPFFPSGSLQFLQDPLWAFAKPSAAASSPLTANELSQEHLLQFDSEALEKQLQAVSLPSLLLLAPHDRATFFPHEVQQQSQPGQDISPSLSHWWLDPGCYATDESDWVAVEAIHSGAEDFAVVGEGEGVSREAGYDLERQHGKEKELLQQQQLQESSLPLTPQPAAASGLAPSTLEGTAKQQVEQSGNQAGSKNDAHEHGLAGVDDLDELLGGQAGSSSGATRAENLQTKQQAEAGTAAPVNVREHGNVLGFAGEDDLDELLGGQAGSSSGAIAMKEEVKTAGGLGGANA
ncbi:unnamed protein product, partial [Closterium sp. NIES-54]